MPIDWGTLIRAGTEGYIGYQRGKTRQHEGERERRRQEEADLVASETNQRQRMMDLIKLRALQNPAKPTPYKVSEGGISGEYETPEAAIAARNQFTQPETPDDDVNWQTEETPGGFVQINPRTGATRPVTSGDGKQIGPPPPREPAPPQPRNPVRPTERQSQILAVLPAAKVALGQINDYLAEKGGTVPGTAWLAKIGNAVTPGQRFVPEEAQAYQQAALVIANAILRAESGGTMTEDEIKNKALAIIPQPGDKPATVKQKLESLRLTMEALERTSTAGIEPEASGEIGDPFAADPDLGTYGRRPGR